MKKIVLFSVAIVLFIASFFVVVALQFWQIKKDQPKPATQLPQQTTPSPTPLLTSPKLPLKQSLTGTIETAEGEIERSLLIQPEPVEATVGAEIFEGEGLKLEEGATSSISFASGATLVLSFEADIALSSTNPSHFLVHQTNGRVEYTTDPTIKEITIRGLHALITLIGGNAEIVVDPDGELIKIMTNEGTGKIGYIDSDNNTQTVELEQGVEYRFNDDRRVIQKN